jgi:hypothetical protein
MRGFQLVNGDIVIGSQGYAEVSGTSKVTQDVSIATMEPYGCDRFHPLWGSLFYNFIGTASTDASVQLIQNEATRIIQNYITTQNNILLSTQIQGQPSTFTNDDVVASITSINVAQTQMTFTVAINLQTASAQSVNLLTTVGS